MEDEVLNFVDMPDDILREIGGRLGTYGRHSLRQSCKELRRIFPKAANKYQVMLDKLIEQRLFKKNWPTYPEDSYILKTVGLKRYALFFSAESGKVHIVPNCTNRKSPIVRLTEADLKVQVIEGKLYKKRAHDEISLWTLGIWMMFSRKNEVPIEEFYPRVYQALKDI